ncbi:hypothetical protein [Algicola sagamiensis]|uniref:hypothetical protein n=1 Tax=Algicola sagamiensis TaxID=163869 RepID=UPI00037C4479|nr:hypothetical protein [Algicola sagamiensis]
MKIKTTIAALLFTQVAAIGFEANAARLTLNDIDFNQAVSNEHLVFAPLKETTSNRGVFWYRDIQQKIVGPSNAGWGIRRVTLRAYPASHDSSVYNDFVRDNSVYDQRENVLPEDAILCEPRQALIDKLTQMRMYYSTRVTRGNYPGLCSLAIKYQEGQQGDEEELVEYLQTHQAFKIQYKIAKPNLPAVYMDLPRIAGQLIEKGALTVDQEQQKLVGQPYEIAFYSSQFPTALYRDDTDASTPLDYPSWKKFMDLFQLSTDGEASLEQAMADQLYVIEPPQDGEVIVEMNMGTE